MAYMLFFLRSLHFTASGWALCIVYNNYIDPVKVYTYNYQAQTKLLEGNVFRSISLSTWWVSVQGGLFPDGVSVQVGSLSGGVSVHGGLCPFGLCPGVVLCPGGLCPGVYLSRGDLCPGGLGQGSLCPGGSLSRGVFVQACLCAGGSRSRGISVQGVSVYGDLYHGPPPQSVMMV